MCNIKSVPIHFLAILLLTKSSNVCSSKEEISFHKPEDILKLEEITVVHIKTIWNLTHAAHALHGTNATGRIKTFWNNLKSTLSVPVKLIRELDKQIVNSQPSILLNKIIQLQELEALQEVSDTTTNDPITHWKVKWIEVSSLATHIHWLFNKRMRDIMNNVPYIKTIANSIAKYYGNPWYSKLSGRKNDAHRYPMRDFPRWIDNRTFTTPKNDLFYGLRQLIDQCKSCKSGSSVRKDACLGNESIAEIEPISLDAPLFVFFYLCLVDIKFYILKNFFHIYREAYENILYTEYSIFDDRLRNRIKSKLEAFSSSFRDYSRQQELLLKVSKGLFRCDPPPLQKRLLKRGHIYKDTFIKLTNFLTDFVVLEKDLTPIGSCSKTCKGLGRADVDPCKKSDEECAAEISPECESNPRLCELFKPICPLTDLVCYNSATSANICPSTISQKLMEWAIINETDAYPRVTSTSHTCTKPLKKYRSTMAKDSVTRNMESCEVCLCQCFEPIEIRGVKDSVRVFSQKETFALVEQNRVVVGIKFEQVDDQIHIMIADAVLLAGFAVDSATVTWRQPLRANEEKREEVIRLGRNLRAIHIDDWNAPEGFAVTGVRFFHAEDEMQNMGDYQGYISIKLKISKVDAVTGKVDFGDSQWVTTSYPGGKSSYRYTSPDEPISAEGPALPDSSINQLVYFRSTALSKTNANEVIPFLDAQKIITEEGGVLKGVGLFHKVKPGHGGFLGWKIMPY